MQIVITAGPKGLQLNSPASPAQTIHILAAVIADLGGKLAREEAKAAPAIEIASVVPRFAGVPR